MTSIEASDVTIAPSRQLLTIDLPYDVLATRIRPYHTFWPGR
jgi:hypothetical protein